MLGTAPPATAPVEVDGVFYRLDSGSGSLEAARSARGPWSYALSPVLSALLKDDPR